MNMLDDASLICKPLKEREVLLFEAMKRSSTPEEKRQYLQSFKRLCTEQGLSEYAHRKLVNFANADKSGANMVCLFIGEVLEGNAAAILPSLLTGCHNESLLHTILVSNTPQLNAHDFCEKVLLPAAKNIQAGISMSRVAMEHLFSLPDFDMKNFHEQLSSGDDGVKSALCLSAIGSIHTPREFYHELQGWLPQYSDQLQRRLVLGMLVKQQDVSILAQFEQPLCRVFAHNQVFAENWQKIFALYHKEKLTFIWDRLLHTPQQSLDFINALFASQACLSDKTGIGEMIEHFLQHDLEKKNLDKSQCFLMLYRLTHTGRQEWMLKVFKHVFEHHDFYQQFRDEIFAGSVIEVVLGGKKRFLDMSGINQRTAFKKIIVDIYDYELPQASGKRVRAKL